VRPLPTLAPSAAAAFGCVLLALVVADVPAAVRLALLVAFTVAVAGAVRHLRQAATTRRLAWGGQAGWSLDGRPVAVVPVTRVYAGLVVLVVREAGRRGRRHALWIPRAAMDPAAFRHLKTGLRFGSAAAPADVRSEAPC
jgi:hypothetical protein